MADEDIQYASVVFKNKKQPQPKSKSCFTHTLEKKTEHIIIIIGLFCQFCY